MIRIEELSMSHIKNVGYGRVPMPCKTANDSPGADVLGIYGQNGSGKTSVINALTIIQELIQGKTLPVYLADAIEISHNQMALDLHLRDVDDEQDLRIHYHVEISRLLTQNEAGPSVYVSNESLSFKDAAIAGQRMERLVEFKADETPFIRPQKKLTVLLGGKPSETPELQVARLLARERGTSFLFSEKMADTIQENCEDLTYKKIFHDLRHYAWCQLFIVGTGDVGLINLNAALFLNFKYQDEHEAMSYGQLPLSLTKQSQIPLRVYDLAVKIFKDLSIVLNAFVPSLKIELTELSRTLDKDNQTMINVEMVSIREGKRIPMRYESEGIKKIVSILSVLIAAYNDASTTLAVDELDSGIFEYLLGEILNVFQETGKGQLIFTSHNLRPLEVLPSPSVLFSTTNPDNRFIQMHNIKPTHNLRNQYYRDIILSGQRECLYRQTNPADIRRAFRKVGKSDGQE